MSALEAILRRDRYAVLGALLLLTALAWAYLFWLAQHMAMPTAAPPMPGMDMSMDMGPQMGIAMTPAFHPWSSTELFFSFVMWWVMMTAMMLPTAAPMVLLYARVGRQAEHQPFAASAWFAGGYLLAWMIFSLLAALLQAGLIRAALLTPMLASTSHVMGGAVLIAAGAYQWSSWKYRCLAGCRAPLAFIQQHGGFKWRPLPALGLGLRHGLYCIGCCWALMLLLFVGGVMNIAWIAGLAVLVLLEKVFTDGRHVSRLIGLMLIAGGLVLAGDAAMV